MLVSLTIQKDYQVSRSSCICRSATRRIGNRLTKQLCPPLEAKALLQFITQNSSSRNISAPSPCKQHGIDFASSSEFRDWSTWWSLKAGKVLRWFQNPLIEPLLWLPHIKDLNFRVRMRHPENKYHKVSRNRKQIKKTHDLSRTMKGPKHFVWQQHRCFAWLRIFVAWYLRWSCFGGIWALRWEWLQIKQIIYFGKTFGFEITIAERLQDSRW